MKIMCECHTRMSSLFVFVFNETLGRSSMSNGNSNTPLSLSSLTNSARNARCRHSHAHAEDRRALGGAIRWRVFAVAPTATTLPFIANQCAVCRQREHLRVCRALRPAESQRRVLKRGTKFQSWIGDEFVMLGRDVEGLPRVSIC
jgi:hypothetical protein